MTVAPTSKLEYVYEVLRGRILGGGYAPGQRLVLDQLARELSVSPVPIREAVRRLEAEGYVEFQHNVGARVASFDEQQFAEITEVLAILEGAATSLAAPHMRRIDLKAARRVNERMRASLVSLDPLAFSADNREFHFVFYGRCPNLQLRAVVEAQWAKLDTIRRSTFIYVPGRAAGSVDEHDNLIRLIENEATPAVIERATRAHKMHTIAALAEASQERKPARSAS